LRVLTSGITGDLVLVVVGRATHDERVGIVSLVNAWA